MELEPPPSIEKSMQNLPFDGPIMSNMLLMRGKARLQVSVQPLYGGSQSVRSQVLCAMARTSPKEGFRVLRRPCRICDAARIRQELKLVILL